MIHLVVLLISTVQNWFSWTAITNHMKQFSTNNSNIQNEILISCSLSLQQVEPFTLHYSIELTLLGCVMLTTWTQLTCQK